MLYPSLRWVVGRLRNNVIYRVRYKVLDGYVVGSEAKGTARPDSDLDIAVIITPVRGRSALQISERYHAQFADDQWKPHWNGRVVDIQFFYPDDPELAGYSRIKLQ